MPDGFHVDDLVHLSARYQNLSPLGRGGMATVFRARDVALARDVAIKVFRAGADDPDHLRAQEREAGLLASFRHHSLVTLFDAEVEFGEDGSPRMFLVMEYVEGVDLRVRLRSGALPLLHVAHLGFDLADAIGYLHDLGVTHRDVKPANVLLSDWAEARRPRVKLADFGIALLSGEQGDEDGHTTGTAAYLSPEQAAGETIGPATDIYSLALVLLEALTGRVAYPGGVVESALARLDAGPAIPDRLPEQWRTLLLAMTARNPIDRPRAGEVAGAFRQILVDEVAATAAPEPTRIVSRISAVRRYDVLAPTTDPALDRISELAVRLLSADGAVIAFHDDDRVLVKSSSGSLFTGRPPHRYLDGTLEADAVEIGDIRPGAAPAPLLTAAEGTGAYLSAPVRTHDGYAIGVVAAFSRQPREFDPDERATLQDLADAVMHETELRRSVRRHLASALGKGGEYSP